MNNSAEIQKMLKKMNIYPIECECGEYNIPDTPEVSKSGRFSLSVSKCKKCKKTNKNEWNRNV